MRSNVNRLVKLGMLSGIALILMFIVRFPIIPAAPFLEYEPGDVPILIAGFIFGPASGVAVTFIVAVIQGITVSAGSGWIGGLMHFIATGTMVTIAAGIYRKMHTLKGAVIGLILGGIAMTLIMIPLNLFLTTKFLGVPYDAVKAMILPAIVPFNVLKAGINSIITLVLYKSVRRILK